MSDLERVQQYRRQAKSLRETAALAPASLGSDYLISAATHLEKRASELEKSLAGDNDTAPKKAG
ncbi:MAG TPA: hypothetical protein VHQ39_08085 [Dongiaceae bacterium]|jgi:hypothetical protein|nr:hypothetical protein [Dongiaceae bacterium]